MPNTVQHFPPGIYPFWFWNGEMDDDAIRSQIDQMAEQGCKGFYIHSRQGMCVPYLSERFFDKVAIAVRAAEAAGLTVHIYDEYPYPSAAAGGKTVFDDPSLIGTRLQQLSFDVPGGHVRRTLVPGTVLSSIAVPLKDDRADWSGQRDLRKHIGMVMDDHSYEETGLTMYNRKRFFASNPVPVLDTNLPQGEWRIFVSVQTIITDHKYWGFYPDVLNPRAVKAFLQNTHEQYLNRFREHFGRSIVSVFTDEVEAGWSAHIPDRFHDTFGYELLPLLPALQDRSHPRADEVRKDLHDLTLKMFIAAFEEPVAQWCADHGLLYTGEKDSLRLCQLKYMDLSGCEPGHVKAGARPDCIKARIRSNARATASAAYFYGKQGALCESFHSLGWSNTLQDAKLISETLLLMGITHLVPHGFFYSTHGLAKHDAPPSYFFQNPYWKHFHLLADRVQELLELFKDTHIDPDLLILDPHGGVPGEAQLSVYEELLVSLSENQREYMIVDTDILESAGIVDGNIHIRDISVRMLVLPPMAVIEDPLQKWLERFTGKGGIVVRISDHEDIVSLLETVGPVVDTGAGDRSRLLCTRRKGKEGRVWFCLNTGREPITLTFREQKRLLSAFESCILTDPVKQQVAGNPAVILASLSAECVLRPRNGNQLRMGEWGLSIVDGKTAKVPVLPMPIVDQLAKANLPYVPSIKKQFGIMPCLEFPEMTVHYEYSFENRYTGPVELVMEPGSINGNWAIDINNTRTITALDLRSMEHHVRGSMGTDVSGDLVQGKNRVLCSVKVSRPDDGLLNPLYLFGDFGVKLDPVTLVDRKDQGQFEQWEENGFPYFAGTMEYAGTCMIDQIPESAQTVLDLCFPAPFQDCCEISVNGGEFEAVPWAPYAVAVPTAQLRTGENDIVIRVYTSLIRSFEGMRWDIDGHCYENIP